ncbi:unnamed protein product [Mycena citricolor]|uniref:FAD/NAD(P)-binding domain-containing protein n=1 Tax=Mycena citricolor TaxID=2018698 RepID=A0AAD2HI41_9AGAR|nr:unnamed protein product [Mycena citricolor]
MTLNKPNVVVVGGSYVGLKFVDLIAAEVSETHNTILIEKNSHFEHLFAFPRISIVPGFAHKAYIPYTSAFHASPSGSTSVVHGVVAQVLPDRVVLDSGDSIPYEYLVIATGTGLYPARAHNKAEEVEFQEALQRRVKDASEVVVIGGGASGIQTATDAKEFYPSKNITLVHSRDQLMNRFHPELHSLVSKKLESLGVKVVLGQRVELPASGRYPVTGPSYSIGLADGTQLHADVAISCTGAVPMSSLITSLSPDLIDEYKYIRVKPTMQVQDERFPNVFAVGDVAGTGANKNARSAFGQIEVAVKNIKSLIAGEAATAEYVAGPFGIHMTTGLWSWILFRDPTGPDQQPHVDLQDTSNFIGTPEETGKLQMGCGRLWEARAPRLADYHL